MKIAVNTRLLLPNKIGGIEWFSYETLIRLVEKRTDWDFHFIFDRSINCKDYEWINDGIAKKMLEAKNVTIHRVYPPTRHSILSVIWLKWSLPRLLKSLKPDLFLSPDGYLPLSGHWRSLSIVHDINFHHFPQFFPWTVERFYNIFFPKFVQSATRIATVSEFSKNDLHSSYGADLAKIDVVYNGINAAYQSSVAKARVSPLSSPYFLFVGTLLPRKNISGLLSAFKEFKKDDQMDCKLVLVGGRKWWSEEMELAYIDLGAKKESVVFAGYCEPEELINYMRNAVALTFVPHFEGFGIPIIEAMTSGVPVITSSIGATAEVAANAACLVNPNEPLEIAAAMKEVLLNEELRSQLIAKGKIRASEFSWDRTTALLEQSILKTMAVPL